MPRRLTQSLSSLLRVTVIGGHCPRSSWSHRVGRCPCPVRLQPARADRNVALAIGCARVQQREAAAGQEARARRQSKEIKNNGSVAEAKEFERAGCMGHKSAKDDNATLIERYYGLCAVQVLAPKHLCCAHHTSAKSAQFGGKGLAFSHD